MRTNIKPVWPVHIEGLVLDEVFAISFKCIRVLFNCKLTIKASVVQAKRQPPTSSKKINEPWHGRGI